MNIDIIGAGIGGLTTALALEAKGFKPTIYEQTKEIKEVGAGIILASNAMKVFQHLKIDDQLKKEGVSLEHLNITNGNLKLLSGIDLRYFEKKYNLQTTVIHRGKLQSILLKNLKHTKIHLNHKLKTATKNASGYLLEFENGEKIKSSLVIGADGIYSKLRNSIASNIITRKTNQVCWRGVINMDLPDKYKNQLNEAWGNKARFAFVKCNKNQVYWYALKSFKNDESEFSISKLSSYFKKYPELVTQIIKTTPINNIHTSIITDLKPIKKWYNEFGCLIGDAAHAATPNMGQGACQAIEDAYVISESIYKHKNANAFKEYQKLRISNAHKVVHQSWMIGKIAHWKNPFAIFCRNQLLKIIPSVFSRYQQEKLFQLNK